MVQISLVAYPEAELETEMPPELRDEWASLNDEVGILREIEDRLIYNHISPQMIDHDPRYKKWQWIAYETSRKLSMELSPYQNPDYRKRLRRLVDSVEGLKGIELPE